jgi:alpha-L-arabinofuranosidase
MRIESSARDLAVTARGKLMKLPLLSVHQILVPVLCLAANLALAADPEVGWTVDSGGPGPEVSPLMHGIFFEDINYAGDGGLYAELVENRSFEHKAAMHAWREEKRGPAAGTQALARAAPIHPQNPRFLRLNVTTVGDGYGVSNLGYGGIPVKGGEEYRFAIHARAGAGYTGGLQVQLEAPDGRVLAEGKIGQLTSSWQRHKLVLACPETVQAARLVVLADAVGQVDLDMISLFPKNTFKGRENGLRADLAQLLADMKPGFMRFPGGCIVEGKDLANAYRWKETVGDIATRKQNWNRWQEVMASPNVSQYSQTYGLGFFEFFQLCEDIGAAPVPILNCGMSCQFQDSQLVPLSGLDPWVQDALDLVEFANGAVTTTWGKVRAEMGHPEPFGLKYLGVGNEQWGPKYFDRYLVFQKALKARYPELILITTSGPGVDDGNWRYAWDRFRKGVPAEIVDEHYYRPLDWFLSQSARYDVYDRNGPKVFAGEFAAHRQDKRNTLDAAVCEAAFMTGLLRNADVVRMSCYAPLLARDGFTQWRPDLVFFDATRVMPTPSYHVQAMYAKNRPDRILPSVFEQNGAREFSGRIGVGTWLTQAEFKDVTVTDGNRVLFRSGQGMDAWERKSGQWSEQGGVLQQSGNDKGAVALAGDRTWTNYTLSLKARKTGGDEGFLILFHSADETDRCWWNIGGWGNTGHALEVQGVESPRVAGKIEANRWYDIRVEVRGNEYSCYLDNKLIHRLQRPVRPQVYAVAGLDRQAAELILHIANPANEPQPVAIHLRGWTSTKDARGEVLTSASPDDANSLDAPHQVAPKPVIVPLSGATLRHNLPPWSHTVLRVPR